MLNLSHSSPICKKDSHNTMQKKALGIVVTLVVGLIAVAAWRATGHRAEEPSPLAAALAAQNPSAAARLAAAVAELHTNPQRLAAMLRDDDWQVRSAACEALGPRADATLVPLLVARASDSDWRVRSVAFDALGRIAPPPGPVPIHNTPLDQREQFLLAWLETYDAAATVKLTPELCEIYADSQHLEFGRPMTGRCLQCHVGTPQRQAVKVESCRPCHQEIFAAWSGSAHANSLTHLAINTIDANTRQPVRMNFAPMTGITCLQCHRPLDGPAASTQTAAGNAACPYRFDPNQPAAGACIQCHGTTWRQWQAWCGQPHPVRRVWPPGQIGTETQVEVTTCVDCHMKRGGPEAQAPRSHSWSARRSLAMLHDGLDAKVAAVPGQDTTLTLTNFAGHDYPTASRRRALAVMAAAGQDANLAPLAVLVPHRPVLCDSSVSPALAPGERRALPLPAHASPLRLEFWYVFQYTPGQIPVPFQVLGNTQVP